MWVSNPTEQPLNRKNKMKFCRECGEDATNGTLCRVHYNEYMKDYMLRRYHKLRAEWISRLGGICVECGTSYNLEFDHIVAEDKEFDIARILSSHSKAKIEYEMAKCQLLCKECHLEKSLLEGDLPTVEHGAGVSGKRNCRCDLCRQKKSEYNRNYRAINGR